MLRTAFYGEMPPDRSGLPRWSLFAALPVALALGFVTGVALSAYRPVPPVPQQVTWQEPAALPPDTTSTSPGPATPPAAHDDPAPLSPSPGEQVRPPAERPSTWANPLPQAVDEPLPYITPLPGLTGPLSGTGAASGPANAYQPAVRTLLEARAVLSAQYQRFNPGDGKGFTVDYQIARDMNYNTLLIGIVKIEEYGEWVRAATEHPAELQSWLEAAARRVRDAALNDGFTLTWTIFETVSAPPYGFSEREVTPDPRGGGYVVTRPLAAVTDVERSAVTIAEVQPAPSRPTAAQSPWSAYGPVLRFDPTDLYRPVSAGKP